MAFLKRKAFYDKDVPTGNWWTTITGIAVMVISIVVSILLAAGKIDPSQATPLNEALGGILAAIGQIIGYVSSIILMFKATDA